MRFALLGLVLATALGIGLFTTIGSGTTQGRPVIGEAAPTFSLPRLGGGAPVGIPSDGGGGGKPAVLLFYASDCTPCRAEIPAVAAFYRHQRSKSVALIGVAAADPDPVGFARSSGITFPVGLDNSLDVTEGKYYFTALPEAVFVNRNGTIAGIHYGAITPVELAGEEAHLAG